MSGMLTLRIKYYKHSTSSSVNSTLGEYTAFHCGGVKRGATSGTKGSLAHHGLTISTELSFLH